MLAAVIIFAGHPASFQINVGGLHENHNAIKSVDLLKLYTSVNFLVQTVKQGLHLCIQF